MGIPRPDCGADKLVVKVDSVDADGISSVAVSIWAAPVRSGGEAGRVRHQREDTTHYLLSVHTVEGEVREPLTDEEMAQSHKQLAVLEQETKSTGAWVASGRHREAAAAYQRAAAMASTDAEQDFLRRGGRASREADR